MYHIRVVLSLAMAAMSFMPAEARATDRQELETSEASTFERIRPIHGHEYKCADMVRIVNSLKRAGKEKAIIELRNYLERTRFDSGREKSILLICRCLFDNPDGWEPPRLGAVIPRVSDSGIKKLPNFPLMFSEGVPFLVIEGYRLNGRGEDPGECIKKCEALPFRKSELPTKGYDAAARSLISSELFSQLYEDAAIRKEMSRMVLRQAVEEKE